MRISDWSSDVCSADLLPLAVLAALSTLVGVNLDLVGIDDGRTLLALADASTKRKRLLEGQPMRRGIALGHDGNPKGDRKSVVLGKRVTVRVVLGGRRSINKKKPP